MSSTYNGNASAAPSGKGLTVTIPSDGDVATAASVNSPGPFENSTDFIEYIYEGLVAMHIINATDNGAVNAMANVNDIIWVESLLIWVAVGDAGQISTSPDGQTWTAQTSNVTPDLLGVAWNGTIFVAVGKASGGGSPPVITTSPDGVTWTARTSPGVNGTIFHQVAWDPVSAIWVLAGTGGWSADGITWHSVSAPGALFVYGIASNGNGTFLAVGTDAAGVNAWTTSDGVTFVAQTVPGLSGTCKAVAYSTQLGAFMVIDDEASPKSAISTSSAGTAWNSAHAGFAGSIAGPQLKWNGRAFVGLINAFGIQYFIPQANTWRVNLPACLVNAGALPLCLGVSDLDFKTLYGLDNGHVLTTLQYPYL